MESVLKKKRKVLHWEGSVEKDGLKPRMKVRGDGILIITNLNVSSITTVYNSIVKCFAQLPIMSSVSPLVDQYMLKLVADGFQSVL